MEVSSQLIISVVLYPRKELSITSEPQSRSWRRQNLWCRRENSAISS